MKLTAREQSERRDAFRRMSAAQKAEYLFSYYKLPIVLTLLFAYILCYGLYRHVTRKEVLLYVACANVVVNEDTADALSEKFIRDSGEDVRKREVFLYQTLYLSDNPTLANHEYAYASRLKLLAAVNAKQIDVVLMNREAYDFLSENGCLSDLSADLLRNAPDLYRQIQPYFAENEIVLEDNGVEVALNEAEEYQAVTKREKNALDVSQFSIFRNADFTDSIFLGVLLNSPRTDAAMDYIAYLQSGVN